MFAGSCAHPVWTFFFSWCWSPSGQISCPRYVLRYFPAGNLSIFDVFSTHINELVLKVFRHFQCLPTINAFQVNPTLMYVSSWDRGRFMKNYVSTLFATLIRNHKNYRDTIVSAGSSPSLLSSLSLCCQTLSFFEQSWRLAYAGCSTHSSSCIFNLNTEYSRSASYNN